MWACMPVQELLSKQQRSRQNATCGWGLLHSSFYTPVDSEVIPTGEVASVEGTPFDFREEHAIGERLAQVKAPPPGGYDTNMVLWGFDGPTAATRTHDCVVSDACAPVMWRFLACFPPS